VELSHLVRALVAGDILTARQWVADANRAGFGWPGVPKPGNLGPGELAVAAGVAELLAARAGQSPPVWTAGIPAAPECILLVRAASFLPRLRRLCEEEGPEPLRRRGILAPPNFLTSA